MNREEQRFIGWIEQENYKVYRMNREGELRFTGLIEKENKGLQDD